MVKGRNFSQQFNRLMLAKRLSAHPQAMYVGTCQKKSMQEDLQIVLLNSDDSTMHKERVAIENMRKICFQMPRLSLMCICRSS